MLNPLAQKSLTYLISLSAAISLPVLLYVLFNLGVEYWVYLFPFYFVMVFIFAIVFYTPMFLIQKKKRWFKLAHFILFPSLAMYSVLMLNELYVFFDHANYTISHFAFRMFRFLEYVAYTTIGGFVFWYLFKKKAHLYV